MEIKKDFDNKLLKRKELEIFFEGGVALKRNEIKDQVVKKLKANANLVVVSFIKSYYGKRDLLAQVFIYENENVMKKLTLGHMQKRNEVKQAQQEEA